MERNPTLSFRCIHKNHGKIIDFWFQKTDADTALIQAVDEPSNPTPPTDGDCNVCGRTGSTMNDVDGDGIPNYLDDDSDNDGISDADENQY